jgi:hypothetical protein
MPLIFARYPARSPDPPAGRADRQHLRAFGGATIHTDSPAGVLRAFYLTARSASVQTVPCDDVSDDRDMDVWETPPS